MKIASTLFLFLWSTLLLQAQIISSPDTIKPGLGNRDLQLKRIKERQKTLFADSLGGTQPTNSHLIDTTKFSKYGDLLNDDPIYNKRQPLWKPIAQVVGINLAFMGYNRYIAKADYGYVDIHSWRRNLKNGLEWDTDEFGINFIGHPYQGNLYFNAARSQGYNYWQSLPFSVGGSVLWEYFGENTKPAYNDLINTPLSGAFLGELTYRLSSNILDDRTRGRERVIRELAAGIINPIRGLNRLLQGKTFQVTNREVYQKEPLNITLFAGIHRLNNEQDDVFGPAGNKVMFSAQLDYGNPFEDRRRKPFDLFRIRAEFSKGSKDTLAGTINNITGYGILVGRNGQLGKLSLLTGVFQYYDYWNTRNFELGALGFGPGLFTRFPFTRKINLYTNVHLGVIPLAGNSTRFAPDENGLRDYVYTTGLHGKIESTISFSKYVTAAFVYYHYWLNTFEGLEGNNSIGIVRPRVTVRLYKNIALGYEHFGYTTNRRLDLYPTQRSVITDQKIFLQLFIEDRQRKGRYN